MGFSDVLQFADEEELYASLGKATNEKVAFPGAKLYNTYQAVKWLHQPLSFVGR
jgi:hypothetical protein